MKSLRLTKDAVRRHEELFPNHESKLQMTDPELIELFDNWAFDEVIGQSSLNTKTRVMTILASTPRTLNALRVIDEVVPLPKAATPAQ